MAKARTFLSILETPFQWPKPGDRALLAVDDPFANARIVTDGYTRVAIMPDAYKKAADLLVEACQQQHWDRDFLVFPIIFNYRQFLELSLKYHLQTFGPRVGVEPNWKWHNLEKLWEQFQGVLSAYGVADPENADASVMSIILEFSKIDPESFSYRYPLLKDGTEVPVSQSEVHLPTLKDKMDAVENYFSGCDGYLHELASSV